MSGRGNKLGTMLQSNRLYREWGTKSAEDRTTLFNNNLYYTV